MSVLEDEIEKEHAALLARSPKELTPIGETAIQAYADGYQAGRTARPTSKELDAAMRYLAAQNVLRKDITVMAAMSAIIGMRTAMTDALEKEVRA